MVLLLLSKQILASALLLHASIAVAALFILARLVMILPLGVTVLVALASTEIWALYLEKYALFAGAFYDPETTPDIVQTALLDSSSLNISYELSAYALMAFAITMGLIAAILPREFGAPAPTKNASSNPRSSHSGHDAIAFLRSAFIILWIVTSVVMLVFNVGASSMISTGTLPYRLAGVTVWSRLILCPVLILVSESIHLEWRGRLSWAFIALPALLGASDALLKTSKGAVLLQTLFMVIFCATLWVRGKNVLSGRQRTVLALLLVLGFASVPLVSAYRQIAADSGETGLANFTEAVAAFGRQNPTFTGATMTAITANLMRLTGLEQLAVAVQNVDQPLWHDGSRMLPDDDVGAYFTHNVYRYPANALIGIAPSYLGWWSLVVGGSLGAAMGGTFVGLFILGVHITGRRLFLPVAEVWESVGGYILMLMLMEGLLEGLWLPFTVGIVCCGIVPRFVQIGKKIVPIRRTVFLVP
jgi:hypothetical protein